MTAFPIRRTELRRGRSHSAMARRSPSRARRGAKAARRRYIAISSDQAVHSMSPMPSTPVAAAVVIYVCGARGRRPKGKTSRNTDLQARHPRQPGRQSPTLIPPGSPQSRSVEECSWLHSFWNSSGLPGVHSRLPLLSCGGCHFYGRLLMALLRYPMLFAVCERERFS
jgi:hypothetical protein